MNIRPELKKQIRQEVTEAKRLNEVDEKRQVNRIKQKKRKDDLVFDLEINRLMGDYLAC